MKDGASGPVLVIGATGRQGGATARALARRNVAVRALVRNQQEPAAQRLVETGAEIAVGDLDDVGSLIGAMAGVSGVFSVQNWWLTGATREVRQGKNVADAAKAARVPHLLYSSVGGEGCAKKGTRYVPHAKTFIAKIPRAT
jgi:uncharacterized protein YbjT (DUF2867 family)